MSAQQKQQDSYIEKRNQHIDSNASTSVISRSTVIQLLLYTFLMVTGPISSYYISKNLLFERFFGLSEDSSSISAAFFAIVIVHIVLGLFIYAAYNEKIPEKKKQD